MDAVEPEPFASLLKGDLKGAFAGGEPAIAQLLMQTHAGMTTDEFNAIVTDWIATARHPKTGRLYTEMVYQPMLELLAYLRANGFKTFIVSGGGIEFMRPWAEKVYGIPPEQVIGSSSKTTFDRETPRRNTVSWQHSSTPEDSFSGDKGRPVAEHVDLRRFEAPDELRIFEKGRLAVVRIGGMVLGRAEYEPGWKWSAHVGPTLGASLCTVEHVGMVLAGTATVAFEDYVSLHLMGADSYAKKPA